LSAGGATAFFWSVALMSPSFITELAFRSYPNMFPFLGAFTTFQRATISLVMSVCPSVHPYETTQLHSVLHLSIFQIPLISDNNNGYFTWRPIYIFLSHLTQFVLEWEMFHTKVVEKVKKHILCWITFFKNCALFEIMWKNIVKLGRPHVTIWHMCIACWRSKATNTHS
jgi:hypothetical protein